MTEPMQSTRPTKFNFDTVFGTKGAASTGQSNRSRSTYSSEEVEAIRKESFAAGRMAATNESIHTHAIALAAIVQNLGTLTQQLDNSIQIMRGESVALALAVAKKLAESLFASCPYDDVVAFISECMHKLHLEPRLVIRVSADIADHIKSQIEPLSEKNGFAGRVIVFVEPTLSGPACRIEWADGGIEQDLSATFTAIEEQATRWITAQTSEENRQ